MGSVGVVIPVLNQFEMAVDAIASIESVHKVETFIIPNYRLQLPLSEAWNVGIKKAFEKSHDAVLVMNDDVLLAPNTIDALYFALKNTEYAMVTAHNIRGSMGDPHFILNHPDIDKSPKQCGGPDFACFMIGWGAWNHVGRFDENFKPAYFEDNDYHRRIILSSMEACSIDTAPYYHYGSQTQNATANPVVSGDNFDRIRNYYIAKWGGESGMEAFTTPYNNPEFNWKDWEKWGE